MAGYIIVASLYVMQAPVLKYLFYLARIGLTTSVISNMSATIRGSRIPLMDYMSCGLLVSLSTQQPVFTHMTRVCVSILLEHSVQLCLLQLSAMWLHEREVQIVQWYSFACR